MFFIERGSQIMEFVNSILDGIGAIVSGSIGAAANLVESSLAKILPLAISFLASLLGVGGIAEKIKEIVEKIRAPISKLITAIVGPLVRPLKKLYDKGAKFVKGVVDKGKALGKKAVDKVRSLGRGKQSAQPESKPPGDGSLADKQARLNKAVAEGKKLMAQPSATVEAVREKLPSIRDNYGLKTLEVVEEKKDRYHIAGTINPTLDSTAGVLFTAAELLEMDETAKGYAKIINDKEKKYPGTRKQFDVDPVAVLRGYVPTGEMVESAAAPGIDKLAKSAGLTVIRNPYIQWVDAGGAIIGGKGPELDFLILGTDTVEKIVSAKLQPAQFRSSVDRKLLQHFVDMPATPPAIVAYVKANFGKNRRYDDIAGANVVHADGKIPLADFKSRYLSKTVVSSIVVEPVTPGPEQTTGLQLRATEPELIAEIVKLVKKYL
jgi:hypothetical protein